MTHSTQSELRGSGFPEYGAPGEQPTSTAADALLDLVRHTLSGAITLQTARHSVVSSGIGAALQLEEINALCNELQRLAHTSASGHAVDAAELLLLAVEGRSDAVSAAPETEIMRHRAAATFVHVVTACLRTHPDWRQYTVARDAGERALQRAAHAANEADARARQSRMHDELAGLHMHPLLANVSSSNDWLVATRAWYVRGDRSSPTQDTRYPEPTDALTMAHTHYMTCANLESGRARGLALNGAVSATEWLARMESRPFPPESLALASDALALLEPERDASAMSYLIALRHSCGLGIDTDALLQLMRVPVPTLMQTIGPAQTVNVRLNMAHLLQPLDSKLALALIESAAPAVEAAQNETLLVRHCSALLNALFEHMSDQCPVPNGPLLLAAQQAVADGDRLQWTPEQVAGVLLKLVARADQTDEEAEALKLFDIARTAAPQVFDAYPAAFRYLRMVLWSGAAVNAARATQWDVAVTGYGAALKLALPLGLRDFADMQLMNLVNASSVGGEAVLQATLGILLEQSLQLQFALGNLGVERLQQLAVELSDQQLSSGEINSELLHLTWRLSKARRFGAAWRSRAARALQQEQLSSARDDLLVGINTLSPHVPIDEQVSGPGSNIARDRRLLAFVRDNTPASGKTASEQLANLQYRFDQLIEQQLAQHALTHEPEYISLAQIQSSLDRRTVVLELFLGEHEQLRMVMTLLTSADHVTASAIPDRVALMKRFSEGERHEVAYSYEEDVYLTREVIINSSTSGSDLAPWLHAAGGSFLHGSAGEALDEAHARGCDHLVIIPHGPFHFAPLQLFARGDRLLADDWTVTVLPSVELLAPQTADRSAGHPREGMAAIALDFITSNPFELSELHGAVDEAERIATLFGAVPIVNEAATPHAIADALQTHRYVHLATHGALNLDAPSFQLLVAAPNNEDDGIVQAHELLTMDLSGLELISLGACETALGRVDRADNPRGLPAALLLAGAQTVVGTLWEVGSDTARVFFVSMYASLATGSSRRDAFRAAQVETRRRFPDARDWGAFYLIGAWD